MIVAQLAGLRSRRDAHRKGPPEALQAILDTAERLLIHTRTVTTAFAKGDIFENRPVEWTVSSTNKIPTLNRFSWK